MKTLTHLILFVFVLCSVVACGDSNPQPDKINPTLSDIKELVVITRNAPTTWYEGKTGPEGPEYDLITNLANEHGLTVRFEVLNSVSEIIDAIRAGKGHIAAAGITKTSIRAQQGLKFGPTYQSVQQQVVCRRNNGVLPKKPEDLVGKKIMVIDSSSYLETLQDLKSYYPNLTWRVTSELGTEQLLEKVWSKQIDCTLADSNIVSINRRYYPELVVAFPIRDSQPMGWILSPKWANLNGSLIPWFENIKENGKLAEINEKYYGHVEIFDYVDNKKFLRRINERLPKFQPLFEEAARAEGVPWSLLAAQAYQESHWRPKAKSPTGVRGMMMLTLNTAKSLGVKSRLDAKQSIDGGAKYIRKMIKRIPDSVKGEDRLWYALAAYNVGLGHVKDAMTLATQLEKNANRWVDLKGVLPLLAQKKYYKSLRYGYARGTEPVRYVQRIRDYQEVLERYIKINHKE